MYKDGAKGKSGGTENGQLLCDVQSIYTPGSMVHVKTCFGDELDGEVVAFDYEQKVLILKNPCAAQANHDDVTIVNLGFMQIAEVKNEVNGGDALSLPPINYNKLHDRMKKALEERVAIKAAFEAGVSSDGLQLYQSLLKTLGQNSVSLSGKNIVVSDVQISPPYNENNCSPFSKGGGPAKSVNQTSLSYAKQLINRFWAEHKPTTAKSEPTPAEAAATSPATGGNKSSSTGTRSPTSPKGRPIGGPATPPGATETSKPASPANVGGKPVGKKDGMRDKGAGHHSPTGQAPKGKKNVKSNGQEKK